MKEPIINVANSVHAQFTACCEFGGLYKLDARYEGLRRELLENTSQ